VDPLIVRVNNTALPPLSPFFLGTRRATLENASTSPID